MICQACGIRFSKTKVDRFQYKDEAYCSEICATDVGWYGTEDASDRSAVLLAALVRAVKDTPPTRVFTRCERQSLNDTLAIVNFQSGAERKAGPPATLLMLLGGLKKFKKKPDLSFWASTLAQLEETVAALVDDVRPPTKIT